MKNKDKKIIKLDKSDKKIPINIGMVMFATIFIYLIIMCSRYFTQVTTNVYEVKQGSIIKDTIYTGLVLRNEKVIKSQEAGYIEYYYPELSRVGINQNMYTISKEESEVISSTNIAEVELTSIELAELKSKVQLFNTTYIESDFSDVYKLKNEMLALLNSNDNQERINTLNDMSNEDSDLYSVYQTDTSGIILYEIDGYERLDESDIKLNTFERNDYSKTLLSSGNKVTTKNEIYKLIVDENWTIYINIDDDDINTYKDISKLNIRFLKDEAIVPADFSIVQINGRNYGKLSLNEGMIRYANERFLDIELIVEELSGFKVPITSIIQENFFVIPKEFVQKGGPNNTTGVLIRTSKNSEIFTDIEIFHYDDLNYYLPLDQLNINDVLVEIDTNDTLIVADTITLNGVYNVNKGYAILKYVNILTSSDEYYIVEEGISTSILNYDYIALYSDQIINGELVY